jgi:GNAT superfamily N-acetyltransferase
VLPSHHGTGVARTLLTHVAKAAARAGARILIIETSDQAPMARARHFYLKSGYEQRGEIPDFYAQGESKIIFSGALPLVER